ncbi:hypothetical protein FISHEDRAFT_59984 [Fistulina hepatica ATCC 64428]|uniref:Uncharacterized protein n=1 Tax=Fistulina hepatica ATCC 64428 TaxID=1128425 RepID=A0A0D7A8B9_9AGAR|nr:hypothetical protein FISHEDRAFT_59984 [Fistulina hepatica ATCC 64428]
MSPCNWPRPASSQRLAIVFLYLTDDRGKENGDSRMLYSVHLHMPGTPPGNVLDEKPTLRRLEMRRVVAIGGGCTASTFLAIFTYLTCITVSSVRKLAQRIPRAEVAQGNGIEPPFDPVFADGST